MAQARRRTLPTAEELRIWRAFIETFDALRSELTARLQHEFGLSAGDYAVLLALSEADGQRLRSSEIAAAIGWERSRLSHHLGRMERRGLVRREQCADDSRGADVVLATAGREAFDRAALPHLQDIRTLFVDALTPDQLATVDAIAAALRERATPRR